MITFIKEFIKKYYVKKGFLIIRYNIYKDILRGIEELYRTHLFKELPESKERINLISQLLGTEVHESFYLLNYLHKSLKLDGDVCEFGVAQGTTSALIANEILNTNKNIWLFDSFEGLPKPSKKDILKDDIFNMGTMKSYEGTMKCASTMVKERLKKIKFPLDRVKIVPGFIEKTIYGKNLPKKVCFAYVDFDFYEPTLIVLNYLDKVLSKGGFIVVDDYDYFSEGIKSAIEEFLSAKKGKYILSFPTKEAGHFCILQKK